jgi:hypothetical protein
VTVTGIAADKDPGRRAASKLGGEVKSEPSRPKSRSSSEEFGGGRLLAGDPARVSGKCKLDEAVQYAISRRDIFERFLIDGGVELDSNIVERAIRPRP